MTLTNLDKNLSVSNKKVNNKESLVEQKWNEWLAGLIDGNGCLLISKEGYCSCEITTNLRDEHSLLLIKSKLGGSVRLRSGVRAVRYRLHNTPGMLNLINRINGKIRVIPRVAQLQAMCFKLSIPYLSPESLSLDNSWFMGYFDANGLINAKFDTLSPTICLSVSNKHKVNLEDFRLLKGEIYYDKACYGFYVWTIQSEAEILNFLDYSKLCPSRSGKLKRLKLIKSFYDLLSMSAHKADPKLEPAKYKAWSILKEKWSKFE